MKKLFQDRIEGGHLLAKELRQYKGRDLIVLAIPRGGVPVGYEVARRLQAPFDLVIPRKLPVPWNPEAGFGAVTAQGSLVLDQRMIEPLGLEEEQINRIAEDVRAEIRRREEEFRAGRPAPELEDKTVIVVDDGIASGYTMLAAVESIRRQNPRQIVVATPVASAGAASMIRSKADRLVTLIESHHLPFAVADYYLYWHDLDDAEVEKYLALAGFATKE
jgi:putative phosphoribosyl transferase